MKKILFFLLPVLFACNTKPKEILVGKDTCSFCKMTVSDNRFGAELVTSKGKIYVFDDEICLIEFLKQHEEIKKNKNEFYFTNFFEDHRLIPVKTAFIVKTKSHRGPMEGNYIAFANKERCDEYIKLNGGELLSWENLVI